MKRSGGRFIAALLSVLLSSAPAQAAKLLYSAGPVQVESKGAARPVKKGAELKTGDTVITGEAATVIIELEDGSRLKLRQHSRLVLESAGEDTSVYLALGGVFAKIKKLTGSRRFKVRTHAAVAAVRGTEFFTAYGRKTRKGHDTWACVNEGSIEVTSAKEKGAVTVKQGEGILIKNGSGLTKPQEFDWTKDLNWSMDAEKGPVEDKTDLGGAYADLLDQIYK